MKFKKAFTNAVFFLLSLGGIHGQESINAAGGEGTGSGGTVSYSVGQVAYTTISGTTGSVVQGVQQPYEISTIVGIADEIIDLKMMVFPNPSTDYLQLEIENHEFKNLQFQLVDIQGKILITNSLTSLVTKINLEDLGAATYFLKIFDEENKLKTFKIIKH